ncbi:MAG: sortase [Hespellia sp.]|nr:sortase [Hespellia sp.]
MKKKIKKIFPVVLLLLGVVLILVIGYLIYQSPIKEAEKRNEAEEKIIENYLDDQTADENAPPVPEESTDEPTYQFSDVDDYSFQGNIDSILVIDKINLKKAIIRGNTLSDNDYNLSKYYFVTADLTTTLEGNYVIYGHSSQTYGHSFNRLDELAVGDRFYLLQGDGKYNYEVESVDRVLRSESESFFPDLKKRVTLVSCEKYLASGYSEKRVIVVRAMQTGKGQ